MSDTAAIAVAVLGTIGAVGSGAVAAMIQMRKSRRAGVKNDDVREQAARVDPVVGFDRLTEHLTAEIDRLQRDLDTAAGQKAELQLQVEAERTRRWRAIQLCRSLYAWIGRKAPDSTPPPVPDSLAEHINSPRKDVEE